MEYTFATPAFFNNNNECVARIQKSLTWRNLRGVDFEHTTVADHAVCSFRTSMLNLEKSGTGLHFQLWQIMFGARKKKPHPTWALHRCPRPTDHPHLQCANESVGAEFEASHKCRAQKRTKRANDSRRQQKAKGTQTHPPAEPNTADGRRWSGKSREAIGKLSNGRGPTAAETDPEQTVADPHYSRNQAFWNISEPTKSTITTTRLNNFISNHRCDCV